MESLSDLIRNLNNPLELEEILSTLDRELRQLITYDILSVLLVEDGGLTPAFVAGADQQPTAWFQTRTGEGVLVRVAQEHRPVLHHIRREQGRIESALIYPIEHDLAVVREVAALLVLQRDGENAFSNGDLQILQNLAPNLAASLENARRYRRSEQLAEADSLTGLANVRSLFQRLDAELARARRSQNTLAVVQCSVEGFELSGRLCSHASTRCAFEKVALRLRENCREYDFTARSGDELVLVLPGFRREFLEEKREMIKRIVEETGVNAGLPLFAAVGAAFFPEDGTDAEDLLAAAAQEVTRVRQAVSSGLPGTY